MLETHGNCRRHLYPAISHVPLSAKSKSVELKTLTGDVVHIIARVLQILACSQPRAHIHICRIGAGNPSCSVDIIPQNSVQQGPGLKIGEVRTRATKAIDIGIECQASVPRWHVRNLTQKEMRANDNIRRATDCNKTLLGIEHALIVVIYPVTIANDLPSSCYADEERRARLVEFLLGRIERNTGGYVLEDFAHIWTVDRRCEEGCEGRTRVSVRDVTANWLQHVPEGVEEADETGRIAVAAIDNGVSATARDVVSS